MVRFLVQAETSGTHHSPPHWNTKGTLQAWNHSCWCFLSDSQHGIALPQSSSAQLTSWAACRWEWSHNRVTIIGTLFQEPLECRRPSTRTDKAKHAPKLSRWVTSPSYKQRFHAQACRTKHFYIPLAEELKPSAWSTTAKIKARIIVCSSQGFGTEGDSAAARRSIHFFKPQRVDTLVENSVV